MATKSAVLGRIQQGIEAAWRPLDDDLRHLQLLAEECAQITEEFEAFGDYHYGQIKDVPTNINKAELLGLYESFAINYLCANEMKQILILWRDVLFEQMKASILQFDGKVGSADARRLRTASKETLLEQAHHASQFCESQFNAPAGEQKKWLSVWVHQSNPWPIYKEQIRELSKQHQALVLEYQDIRSAQIVFGNIADSIVAEIDACVGKVGALKDSTNQVLAQVDGGLGTKNRELLQAIQKTDEDIQEVRCDSSIISYFESETEKINSRNRFSIDVDAGEIRYLTFPLKRTAKQWLDSEMLPLIFEMHDAVESARTLLEVTLANMRNGILLLINDNVEAPLAVDKNAFGSALKSTIKSLDETDAEVRAVRADVLERLRSEFLMSLLYDSTKQFLAVSLQSAINQLKLNQNQFVLKLGEWWGETKQSLRSYRNKVEIAGRAGISEKIAQYIEARTCEKANIQYNNIFLTRSYVGKSFWVGRQAELDRFEKNLSLWKSGFRGGILLSGQRLCGKTLFGEYVANQYFGGCIISLKPQTAINVNGRSFNVKHDLSEALEFAKKYFLVERPLVWIDDLELWSDTGTTLGENVRNLAHFIDGHSGRMFFVVSISNWLKKRLDMAYGFSKAFQTEINLDSMSYEDVQASLLVRHGATHKKLTDATGEELPSGRLARQIRKIYKYSEGNIGEALLSWAACCGPFDEGRVAMSEVKNHILPDFLSPDNAVLLKTVMLERRTNEYRLRKLFGPSFKDKYSYITKRLVMAGVLVRHLDGMLEVNELLVNQLGKNMERKNYLQFYHKQ